MEAKVLFNKQKILYFTNWNNHYRIISNFIQMLSNFNAKPILLGPFTLIKYEEGRKKYYLIDCRGKRMIAGIVRDDKESIEKIIYAFFETLREKASSLLGKEIAFTFSNDEIVFGEVKGINCAMWHELEVHFTGRRFDVEGCLKRDSEGNKAIVVKAESIAEILLQLILVV